MLIRVRYPDNTCGMVEDSRLDRMIEEEAIVEFLRTSGWVRIGRDPVRRRFAERRGQGRLINTYV